MSKDQRGKRMRRKFKHGCSWFVYAEKPQHGYWFDDPVEANRYAEFLRETRGFYPTVYPRGPLNAVSDREFQKWKLARDVADAR